MEDVKRGMKSKTIKAIIAKKFKDWTDTIDDEEVKTLVKRNTIITGGCIASMLLGEKVNDFDVYFRNRETTQKVAEYYVKRFGKPKNAAGIECAIYVDTAKEDRIGIIVKSAGVASEEGSEKEYQYFEARPEDEAGEYVGEIMTDPGEIQDTYEKLQELAENTEDDGKPKYRPVFLSTNAISLSNRVQIVLRFYGNPDEIHGNYDFVHCTNYWTSWDEQLVLRADALEALLARELKYVGSKYPVCSVFRLRKFIRRGWTINAGQILKMAMQISELNLTDVATLQDQLTGVDSAYFLQILGKLKEKDPDKVNTAYLVEIIDRMF